MSVLAWDQPGEKEYQSGVDRGVLYLPDGDAVVWNGLTSVEDTSTADIRSYFLDGRKYLEFLFPSDFAGKLTAYTYPDELDAVTGIVEGAPGLFYHDQAGTSFSLSYRTKIGNDLVGIDYGYKIHILYNVLANPDGHTLSTINESVEATEFSWSLSGKPSLIADFLFRPTAHVSMDSTKVSLDEVEDILYGTGSEDPYLPSIEELAALFGPEGP